MEHNVQKNIQNIYKKIYYRNLHSRKTKNYNSENSKRTISKVMNSIINTSLGPFFDRSESLGNLKYLIF